MTVRTACQMGPSWSVGAAPQRQEAGGTSDDNLGPVILTSSIECSVEVPHQEQLCLTTACQPETGGNPLRPKAPSRGPGRVLRVIPKDEPRGSGNNIRFFLHHEFHDCWFGHSRQRPMPCPMAISRLDTRTRPIDRGQRHGLLLPVSLLRP